VANSSAVLQVIPVTWFFRAQAAAVGRLAPR
jgi:hypothetical protein